MMYAIHMKRTQIYLPQQQHDHLKSLALKQQTTVSEVIRRIINDKSVADSHIGSIKKPSYKTAGDWLLEQAEWAEKANVHGPTDLATNLDEYLYG